MLLDFDKVQFLVGDCHVLQKMENPRPRRAFDDRVVEFLNSLSRSLLTKPGYREYVDVISYAFWIRRAHIEKEKERFLAGKREQKVGRGVSFHITPSNVPVNFAVSMTSAILAGNACVIRVSSKPFEQVRIVTKEMRTLLETEYADLADYFCVLRYEYDEKITGYLSGMCDLRIVWGGNMTIDKIRQYPLKPRAIEMTFADRHSLAVIQSESYLGEDPGQVADLFYTDTYYTDQNACSSPRMVVWMGEKIVEARERFWSALEEKVGREYEFSPVLAIDKQDVFCRLAMKHVSVRREGGDNVCMRVVLPELWDDVMEYKMHGGYFFEYMAKELHEILPVLAKECQTISYLGVKKEEILQMVADHGCLGVDRIVPVGYTMDLSFFWDGYDMIDAMSRYVMAK